jgi:CheY-like chemotaxis protein
MSHDSPIRLLVVDDHRLFRQGIAALIEEVPDMVLAAEGANGRQAIDLFRQHCPDVTLMDLQMADMTGLEAITAIRAEFPAALHRADDLRRRCPGDAGAAGGGLRRPAEEHHERGAAGCAAVALTSTERRLFEETTA